MTNERLSHLTLMSIEYDILRQTDVTKLISKTLQKLSLVKYLVCKFYCYIVYTILDLRCLIIHLIHYKMYISILS